jgi:hypothetical protein
VHTQTSERVEGVQYTAYDHMVHSGKHVGNAAASGLVVCPLSRKSMRPRCESHHSEIDDPITSLKTVSLIRCFGVLAGDECFPLPLRDSCGMRALSIAA